MEWALGVELANSLRTTRFLNTDGNLQIAGIETLQTQGVPATKKRHRTTFEGSFEAWEQVCADQYLAAFGLTVPADIQNRHQVFSCKLKDRTLVVPALVLMRAFFKPNPALLTRMFSPTNIDEVSFVDYSTSPPVVVVDSKYCLKRFSNINCGGRQDTAIRWLQTSKSARQMTQSVHTNAVAGCLGLKLPAGSVRLVLHGLEVDTTIYVTQAALVSANISAADTITNQSERFIFHAMADSARQATASAMYVQAPLRADGEACVTDEEWTVIKPMLRTKMGLSKEMHSSRLLLDGILFKIANRQPWKKVPCLSGTVGDLISTFRRWTTSNRLQPVLAYLHTSRA